MKYIIFIFFLISTHALAKEELKFMPDSWTKGLHLNVGGGLQGTYFDSDDRYSGLGYGPIFKTDLGYFFNNRLAIEWSSNVKFNLVDEYLVWDTLITGGIRYRVKEYYLRAFYGKAPTVIFLNDSTPAEYKSRDAERLQFDGPVYGMAVGKYYKNDKDIIWFLETSATFQRLEERDTIRMDGEVPMVTNTVKDSSRVVSLYLMIGLLLF